MQQTSNNILVSLFKGLILLLIISQVIVAALREIHPFAPQPLKITLNENTKLARSSLSLGNVTAFLNNMPDVNHLLVLRQGENLKYTKHKIIHAYDKRMSKIASSTSLLETIKILNELGINYIVNTHYQDPVILYTFLKEIMNNPRFSSLLYFDEYYSVYKIFNEPKLEKISSTLNLRISRSNDLLLAIFYDAFKLYKIKNNNKNYNYSEYLLEIEVESSAITPLNITATSDHKRGKYNIAAVLLPGKNIIKERFITSILTKDLLFSLKAKKKANIKIKKALITPVRAYQIKSNKIQIPIIIEGKVCRLDNNICKLDELNKKVYPEHQKNDDVTLIIKGTGTICHYTKMRLLGINIIDLKNECFSLDNKPRKVNIAEDEYLALTTHGAYLEISEAKIAE